jgi:tetratricopeptide (TPR) repeat protein
LVDEAKIVAYEPLTAEALALLGTILAKSHDNVAAEAAFVEAFHVADSARHDEVRAEVAGDLVFVTGYLQGRFQDGYAWAKTAEAILKRIGGHDLLHAWFLNDFGCVLELGGRHEEAAQAQRQAIALKEKVLGREHRDIGISEASLAISLEGMGRNQEALAHAERSVEILEKSLGNGHPDLAISLVDQGEILNTLGRYREAHEAFDRARRIWATEVGPENILMTYALHGIGTTYLAEGNPRDALTPLRRAYELRKAKEPEPSRRAETSFALARALWESNQDRREARVLAAEAAKDYAQSNSKTKSSAVEEWLRGRN